MSVIGIINFEGVIEEESKAFRVRNTARAVIFDADKNIALMSATKQGFHKLPGGGIDDGEEVSEALIRECHEEAGVVIGNMVELGQIVEIKKVHQIVQNSYCFIASVVGDKNLPELTESEKENGFELMWVPFDEAIRLVVADGCSSIAGRYVNERELIILNRAKEVMPKTKLIL